MIFLYTFIINFLLEQGNYHLILNPGQYKVFCYGAQGGSSYSNGERSSNGGKGAYVSGTMTFGGTKRNFYAFVGGKGLEGPKGPNEGGFNGGGSGGKDGEILGGNDASGGGGGATDLRIDDDSINNRIIVAAGGSGAADACEGAPGGDLTGYMPNYNNEFIASSEVTQTSGNSNGFGGVGVNSMYVPGSGGGGGWNGGITSGDWSYIKNHSYMAVAHSGSSYISGHIGCIKNYKMKFTGTQMTVGFQSGNGRLLIEVDWECSLEDHMCKNGSIILYCFEGFIEYNEKCVSSCPPGFVEINKKCVECTGHCATCQNSTSSCTSCLSGFLYNNQCLSECPNETVNTGTSCVKCQSENEKCAPINLIDKSQIITLKSGRYRVKCYGAQGGQSFNFTKPFKSGGRGAYVTGIMNLEGTETTFYINIGKIGGSSINEISQGGKNGGGKGGKILGKSIEGISSSGGGGGSTDIRIHDNSTSNRIIVASGGSGASYGCDGAPGGTLTGMIPIDNNNFINSERTNQNPQEPIEVSNDGLDSEYIPQSGGGGGFFGGLTSNQIGRYENESWKSVSESGNSYLSGYEGCANHRFMVFEEGEMISGYNIGDGKVEIEALFECPFNCYSCTSQTKCTKCFDNYFLFNDGKECVLKCPIDYSEVEGQCVKCISPCETCSSSPTTCISCIENYSLYQNKCYLNCPDGTYSASIMPTGLECLNCKSPCNTCTNSIDYCLSCIEGYYLLNNECVSNCPEGTTLIGNECSLCQFPCSKCSESVLKCIECKYGYYLNGNTCVSSCPAGMTQTDKSCISCEASKSCSKSIKNITESQKFTLKSGVYEVNLYGGQGGNSYKSSSTYKLGGRGAHVFGVMRIDGEGISFFGNVGESGHSSTNQTNNGGIGGGGSGGKYTGSTSTGISASGGGGGASDLRIYDNATSSRIIVAAGGSGAAYGCQGAPGGTLKGMAPVKNDNFVESDKVDQIKGDSSGIGGSGIRSSFIPQSGAGGGYRGGVKTMQYGQNDIDSWKSVSHSGSSYISGYLGCEIHESMVFTNPKMESGYRSGDGYITINPIFECSYKCHTCLNETTCTRCFDNYLLYKNRCVLSCPLDSILLDRKCELCNSSCLTCSNSTYNCTSCKDGYYFYQNECVTDCPKGYIGINRTCEQCSALCSSCATSKTTCTSCILGYFLYENECVINCPLGFFKSNGICKKCISPCKTCTSESLCIECQENYYFYNNRCLRSCPEGYIDVNMTCEKCDSPCQTCIYTKNNCTSCMLNFNLYKTQCLPSCPNGTIGINKVCEPCILPCETCLISQTKCQTCNKGYSFYEGECIDACPDGFVDIDGFCEQCQENCYACQNTTIECTKCKSGFYLYENTCVSSCPKNYYIYESICLSTCPNKTFIFEGKCEKCEDSCESCSTSKDNCDTCANDMFIYDHHCYKDCDQIAENDHFGKDDENKECRKCLDQNCIKCSEDHSICTECRSYFYLEDNYCIQFQSFEFTKSNEFSDSSRFSKSPTFTESTAFSASSLFTRSMKFTLSFTFIQSSFFSYSNDFSSSSEFSQSFDFSETKKFTITLPFSVSSLFKHSTSFTISFYFTQSSHFCHSYIFTSSSEFTQSSPFSVLSLFTRSYSPEINPDITQSSFFSHSYIFTSSSEFTDSSPFSATLIYMSSFPFSESSKISPSLYFTNTFNFEQLTPINPTYFFTQSSYFTESSLFPSSVPFTSSFGIIKSFLFTKLSSFSEFSSSFLITRSFQFEFTKSSLFTQSINVKDTTFFTRLSPFIMTSSYNDLTYSTQSLVSISFESRISSNKLSFIISEIIIGINTYPESRIRDQIPTNELGISESRPKEKKTPMIIGVSIAILLIVIASILIVLFFILKKKKQEDENENTEKTDENNQENDQHTNENFTLMIQNQDESDRDINFWL